MGDQIHIIRSTNPQRFSSGAGGGGPEREPADQVYLEKTAIK